MILRRRVCSGMSSFVFLSSFAVAAAAVVIIVVAAATASSFLSSFSSFSTSFCDARGGDAVAPAWNENNRLLDMLAAQKAKEAAIDLAKRNAADAAAETGHLSNTSSKVKRMKGCG